MGGDRRRLEAVHVGVFDFVRGRVADHLLLVNSRRTVSRSV